MVKTYKLKVEREKYSSNIRKGYKFTNVENLYLKMLKIYFKNSMLNIPDNYPLLIFLSYCIGRNKMSISKKFYGKDAIGKQRYRFIDYSKDNALFKRNLKKCKVSEDEFKKTQGKFKSIIKEYLKKETPDKENITCIFWPEIVSLNSNSIEEYECSESLLDPSNSIEEDECSESLLDPSNSIEDNKYPELTTPLTSDNNECVELKNPLTNDDIDKLLNYFHLLEYDSIPI